MDAGRTLEQSRSELSKCALFGLLEGLLHCDSGVNATMTAR